MLSTFLRMTAQVATLAHRNCGHKRPKRRAEASAAILPNVRSKECTIHLTKNGTYALVPEYRMNPSLFKKPLYLKSNRYGDATYLRTWRMAKKPDGGKKLVEIDFRMERDK